jgi:hypothetical protein
MSSAVRGFLLRRGSGETAKAIATETRAETRMSLPSSEQCFPWNARLRHIREARKVKPTSRSRLRIHWNHGFFPRIRWQRLATESTNPRSAKLDRLGIARSWRSCSPRTGGSRGGAQRRGRPSSRRRRRSRRRSLGGTCFLFGAATSGRLAVIEAAELPPTFGTDPKRVRAVIAGGRSAVFRAREGAEDNYEDGARRAGGVRRGDTVIGVSASSVTAFVRGALDRAESAARRPCS